MSAAGPRHRPERSGIGTLRAWSIAVGFALGQVGPLVGATTERRPAIVRDLVEPSAGGFHPAERLPGGVVLTLPWAHGVSGPNGVSREHRPTSLN